MGRKATKCRKTCKNHLFSLKPLHYSAYFSKEVVLSFCPPTLKHPPILPVFNTDGKYYTSTFSLKEDQKKYEINDSIYKSQHEKCCMAQANGKSEMLIPKPRSKCQYCHACKEYYEDYLDHIEKEEHKIKARRNKFSIYIEEMINAKYPKNEEKDQDSPQNLQESYNSLEKDVPTSLASLINEHKQSFTSFKGINPSQFPAHNLKRCDSYRLTIGSEGNKEILSPHLENQQKKNSNQASNENMVNQGNKMTNLLVVNSAFQI